MSTTNARTPKESAALFDLGHVVATRSVMASMELSPTFAALVASSLQRHHEGNWGTLTLADTTANDLALIHRERLLSVYPIPAGELSGSRLDGRVWVITEGDRSATTVLFPSEY